MHMDGSAGKQYLKEYIMRIKPFMEAFFSEAENNVVSMELGDISLDLVRNFRDSVTAGKGIRGALMNLTYKACGGSNTEEMLKTSSFIEIFHTAILVQDDFMDRDALRRGQKAIHKIYEDKAAELGIKVPADHYGNTLAVCMSDTGFYYSWKILMDSAFESDIKVAAGKLYADYISRLGLGQALDMTISGATKTTQNDALKVLYLKTVEYTAILPMLLGATFAGENDAKKLEAITEYAKCLGWAFQIQDDILGLYADEKELGKPVSSDIQEGKNTLLMIKFREIATPDQRSLQDNVLGNPDSAPADVEKLKNLLKDTGAYQHVLDLGYEYVRKGTQKINSITDDPQSRAILESLITYMMERTK